MEKNSLSEEVRFQLVLEILQESDDRIVADKLFHDAGPRVTTEVEAGMTIHGQCWGPEMCGRGRGRVRKLFAASADGRGRLTPKNSRTRTDADH